MGRFMQQISPQITGGADTRARGSGQAHVGCVGCVALPCWALKAFILGVLWASWRQALVSGLAGSMLSCTGRTAQEGSGIHRGSTPVRSQE